MNGDQFEPLVEIEDPEEWMLPTIAAEVTLFRLEEKGEGALADFAERSKHLFLVTE